MGLLMSELILLLVRFYSEVLGVEFSWCSSRKCGCTASNGLQSRIVLFVYFSLLVDVLLSSVLAFVLWPSNRCIAICRQRCFPSLVVLDPSVLIKYFEVLIACSKWTEASP